MIIWSELYLMHCRRKICVYGHFLFWVGKIFKTKFPKITTFVIISLNFLNNQWNYRKNFFIVSMIGLHTWNSKIRSKNWEKWSFVFFSLKTNFCDLKLKLLSRPLLIPEKLETMLRSKVLPQMRTLWSNYSLDLKLVKHARYVYCNFSSLNIS